MKQFWIIEDQLHEDGFYADLTKTLPDLGIGFQLCKVSSFEHEDSANKKFLTRVFSDHATECVFPYGSIQFLKWVTTSPAISSFFQGDKGVLNAFFDLRRLAWSFYASHWGKYLLSDKFVILPYGELLRRKDWAYEIFGDSEKKAIFVRPVENDKVFTGKVIWRDTFDQDIRKAGYNVEMDFSPEMLVVIAEPKKVLKEWRLAVVNGKVVSCGLYNVDGWHAENAGEGCDDQRVMDLAKQIAEDPWQPCGAYVMDVCSTKDDLVKLLEIGSINSAGWYGMSISAIAKALQEDVDKYEAECAKP